MSMNKTQRCQAAMDYRRQGLNCSQCLLAAFRDRAGLTLEQAMALGAGMGGVRCGSICGAVSAPVMLLGTACPDPTDRPAVTAVVKEYQRRFLEHFHRMDCRELLRAQDLEPSELALELAGGVRCGRLIVTAAELLTDMLEEA